MLKRAVFFLFLSLILSSFANAQDYRKFKLGLGAGYASRIGVRSGTLLTIEPAYRLSDNLALGLRLEATGGLYSSGGSGAPSIDGSATVNAQYYFSRGIVRPFIGAGYGFYYAHDRRFGFYPRLGCDIGHFTIALEYNAIPATAQRSESNNYVGVRIGGFFFGGRTRNK